MSNPGRAEEVRLRYLYRDLVLRGRLKLPRDRAVKRVGPDCAYHLYRSLEDNRTGNGPQGRARKARETATS